MEWKRKKNELVFNVCPFCGNRNRNFEFNVVSLLWHCWACNKGGKGVEILKQMGVYFEVEKEIAFGEVIQETSINKKALPDGFVSLKEAPNCEIVNSLRSYLIVERGVREDDWGYFSIGTVLEGDEKWRGKMIFPFIDQGVVFYFIGRSVEGYYKKPEGKIDRLCRYFAKNEKKGNELVIVEGVFDGIRVSRAGWDCVVLLGCGVSDDTAKLIIQEYCPLILALDRETGLQTYNLFRRLESKVYPLDELKIFNISLPEGVKDLGELPIDEVAKVLLNKCEINFGTTIKRIVEKW